MTRRDHKIMLRVTQEELGALERTAEAADLPLSSWCRDAALRAAGKPSDADRIADLERRVERLEKST